jgi:hypothetical protein
MAREQGPRVCPECDTGRLTISRPPWEWGTGYVIRKVASNSWEARKHAGEVRVHRWRDARAVKVYCKACAITVAEKYNAEIREQRNREERDRRRERLAKEAQDTHAVAFLRGVQRAWESILRHPDYRPSTPHAPYLDGERAKSWRDGFNWCMKVGPRYIAQAKDDLFAQARAEKTAGEGRILL